MAGDNFIKALAALEKGRIVYRPCWPTGPDGYANLTKRDGKIVLRLTPNYDAQQVEWRPRSEDLLANDWVIVNAEYRPPNILPDISLSDTIFSISSVTETMRFG